MTIEDSNVFDPPRKAKFENKHSFFRLAFNVHKLSDGLPIQVFLSYIDNMCEAIKASDEIYIFIRTQYKNIKIFQEAHHEENHDSIYLTKDMTLFVYFRTVSRRRLGQVLKYVDACVKEETFDFVKNMTENWEK